MRPYKLTYNEQMQKLVDEYRASGEQWPATRRDMARWMLRNKKWDRCEESLVEMCARDIARALREEYYTDPQGRRVRTKHAAKFPAPDTEDGQKTLWDDIRTAHRPFMERAFKGRRSQIVGDCVQLNTDVKSYNDNKANDNPILMLWDFTDDVLESEQTGVISEETADDSECSSADMTVQDEDTPLKMLDPDGPLIPYVPDSFDERQKGRSKSPDSPTASSLPTSR